jgi:cysteine desulfurase/selenocysteine lyase
MTAQKKENIRSHFPYFKAQKNEGQIYFDSAATTQKPQSVIDAVVGFYESYNSNIHRSVHPDGALATRNYEQTRLLVQKFISAKATEEIVFTSGATESINLVANSYVKSILNKDDIILTSPIEHHSNILPWEMLAKSKGAKVVNIPLDKNFKIDPDQLERLIGSRVKFISIQQTSNITGSEQDVKRIVTIAHRHRIPVLVDGAQTVAHKAINVSDLGCDFYCFSGHKIFGPTGTGVLYGKSKLLKKMIPSKFGGGMVKSVMGQSSVWNSLPHRLEAGTPNIAGIIGLGEAIGFIQSIGFEFIKKEEASLANYLLAALKGFGLVEIYSSEDKPCPILAFNVAGLHYYDVATLLAENGVLIRSGELCSQPLMKHLNIDGCLRASLSFYNTKKEVDLFILALKRVVKVLKG